MRLERPGGPIIELFGGLAVAGEQRFSGSHALKTVTMERAGAGERIVAVVMRDEDVAELGVHKPVGGSAIEHDAGANARARRHVDEVRQPPSGAPALLGKRCRIHIGVEGNGDV